MGLDVIPLLNLLKSDSTEEEIKTLLFSFECNSILTGSSSAGHINFVQFSVDNPISIQ